MKNCFFFLLLLRIVYPLDVCPENLKPFHLPESSLSSLDGTFASLKSLANDYLINETTSPGMMVAVVYNDRIIYQFGLGTTNKSDPASVPDENTIFRIGSVTKVFTAIMLYQMEQEGKIESMNSLLTDYAPNFFIQNPYPAELTFKQLVSQLSGLPRHTPCQPPCNVTTETIFERLENMSLVRPPNKKASYSNLGFALLGRILETPAQTSYENWVQHEILEKLEMTRSGSNFTENVLNEMAVGYMESGEVAPFTDLGWENPSGNLYSSAKDLSKLMLHFFGAYHNAPSADALGLPPAVVRKLFEVVYLDNSGNSGFGTPWEMVFLHNYFVRTKGGNLSGYSAGFSVVPELKLGVISLWNGAANGNDFSTMAMDLLLPEFKRVLAPLQPKMPIPPPNPEKYTGKYSRFDLEANVIAKNNQLFLDVYGAEYPISWAEKETFQIYVPPVLTCLQLEIMADSFQYVVFSTEPSSGEIVSFSTPSIEYGAVWTKEQSSTSTTGTSSVIKNDPNLLILFFATILGFILLN